MNALLGSKEKKSRPKALINLTENEAMATSHI